ncbi:hypothetical protein [Gynuella sp.]|uniref:hypothetical protein n=1 Tax=Gynuella sp. TaxID=2969146 RepID=UPI003D0DFEE6
MKRLLFLSVALLASCSSTPELVQTDECAGTTELPADFQSLFSEVEDAALLNSALGSANNGKLCQGQVYQLNADASLTLFRAWNSTNPYSRMGAWWALQKPAGSIAQYRSDYEICYQWSALDALVSCELKPGTKVVIGNGQSAQCSQYLTYPVSAALQVYLPDADQSMINCSTAEAVFFWQ